MKHVFRSLLVATFVACAAGCAGYVYGTATVRSPTLVSIGNGVWVVEDQSIPVFYANDYYWRYSGGVWYRSSVYRGGWTHVHVNLVPYSIRRIDHPRRYVGFHARAGARRRVVHQRGAPQRVQVQGDEPVRRGRVHHPGPSRSVGVRVQGTPPSARGRVRVRGGGDDDDGRRRGMRRDDDRPGVRDHGRGQGRGRGQPNRGHGGGHMGR